MTTPRDAALPEMQYLTVDGVPVFFIEADEPTVAGLIFRVGQADETAPTRGLTHLIEHLAVHAIGSVRYQHNATVDQAETTFMVRGDPSEVASYLRSICLTLGSLPVDRSALEARVLRTEAAGRNVGVPAAMSYLRYGYVGYGLVWLPEFFLSDPRPDALSAWATSRFNSGNCALWVVGKMPQGLTLPLPAGSAYPLPPAREIRGLTLPAAAVGPSDTVAIDYISPRSPESTTLVRLLLDRFHRQVREAKGLTYLVAAWRQPLSTASAENTLWLSCLESEAGQVRAEVLAILTEMAGKGPTEQEMEEDLEAYIRSGADPDSRVSHVVGAANYSISGMPRYTVRQFLDEQLAVTPAGCAAELGRALQTAILSAPGSVGGPPLGMNVYPITAAPVSGTAFKRQGSKPWDKSETLVLGPEGISRVSPNGQQAVTVRWAECVGWVRDTDGTWHVLGADGFSVEFRPADWADAVTLCQWVERSISPELRIVGLT